jgi:hypothetical protein
VQQNLGKYLSFMFKDSNLTTGGILINSGLVALIVVLIKNLNFSINM